MSWCCEGIPRDVEPAVASQELVGIGAGAKEVDKLKMITELCVFHG
jgi:hypothetical protein